MGENLTALMSAKSPPSLGCLRSRTHDQEPRPFSTAAGVTDGYWQPPATAKPGFDIDTLGFNNDY